MLVVVNGQDDGQDVKRIWGGWLLLLFGFFYGLFYLWIDVVFFYVVVQGVDQVVYCVGCYIVVCFMGGGVDMWQCDDVWQVQQW